VSDAWVGAAFTTLGAVVGALSSSLTTILQGRRQSIAEMKKTAVQLALEDFRFRVQDTSGRVDAVPASALIFYYDKLMDLTVRGELTSSALQALLRDQWQLQLAAQEEAERLQASARKGRSHDSRGRDTRGDA